MKTKKVQERIHKRDNFCKSRENVMRTPFWRQMMQGQKEDKCQNWSREKCEEDVKGKITRKEKA